jgi:Domain of unknown function (DUF1902)
MRKAGALCYVAPTVAGARKMRVAVVKAAHDDDAGVWYVEHSDVEGLHVEGETFESFCRNVADAVSDLAEADGAGDVHVEIIAHASVRARAAA